ncbi:Flavokinase-domain-containing protein [Haematococcus lacustris]
MGVRCVILDLDGTLLDTETLCMAVSKQVLAQFGKELTQEAVKVALGKRPLECWTDVARVLQLDVPPQTLLDLTEPLLQQRWGDAPLLPGALRLVQHLHAHKVPFAVATSSSRATFGLKMANKPQLARMLSTVVCGDEVPRGKPHPDIFLEAARQLGMQPTECLVVEDAPCGVQGGIAAGMRVVVVPSLVGKHCDGSEYPAPDSSAEAGVVERVPSLLTWHPEAYGLPGFTDLVAGVTPLEQPICIQGKVIKGFGRGSKELGIPTANVDPSALLDVLSGAVTGIYCGWASINAEPKVYPMCMSLGYNPFFGNDEKTAEPWLLAEEPLPPFYGSEIRLVVVGYIRPEANFNSLQALVDRIHEDAATTRRALLHPTLACHQQHPLFHKPCIL